MTSKYVNTKFNKIYKGYLSILYIKVTQKYINYNTKIIIKIGGVISERIMYIKIEPSYFEVR